MVSSSFFNFSLCSEVMIVTGIDKTRWVLNFFRGFFFRFAGNRECTMDITGFVALCEADALLEITYDLDM